MRILLAEEQTKNISFEVPSWAFIPDDEMGELQAQVGNVYCKECKQVQSHKNKACVHCCKHENLRLTTERLESLSVEGIDILAVVCEKCGKQYGQDEWEELYGRKIVNE